MAQEMRISNFVDDKGTLGDETLIGDGGGTVDQSYNASSMNAQSGTAVADAISAIPAAPVFAVKAGNADNIDLPPGERLNIEITVVNTADAAAGYKIVGFKRVFVTNATTGGFNRDLIALNSISTGGNSTRANIAVRNTGNSLANIMVEVECLCMKM